MNAMDPITLVAAGIFLAAFLLLAGRARGHRIIRDAHIHETMRRFE